MPNERLRLGAGRIPSNESSARAGRWVAFCEAPSRRGLALETTRGVTRFDALIGRLRGQNRRGREARTRSCGAARYPPPGADLRACRESVESQESRFHKTVRLMPSPGHGSQDGGHYVRSACRTFRVTLRFRVTYVRLSYVSRGVRSRGVRFRAAYVRVAYVVVRL